mmetsp:Transcript_43032/g.86998  ORF Transcript_43032/g.86998 Transcript_43032/m.86998 type:complete len:368 (+) Transcript_43032:30-1133(+)|eukprot:CAMPEP_0171725306 /NCGR_PEP_ID=MMETSP0991-20121206/24916_1 /TAXON_ID=483369 /ORGANISM="non described non described, Strain CCMP2098" /LENGTH=367 /DNA_ID=CAMNT_0012318421 /DNA_START=30 /DNA_END=1133 /DNA_ORIENTATION=+
MNCTIDDNISEAWQDLQDDKTETSWLIAGYEGKNIKVTSKGTGGRTECLAAITSDSNVVFGAFRLSAVDDRGSTKSTRPKFVIFMYRAPNAAAMAKAKAGRHMGQVEQAFYGHHIMFQVDELYEISEAEVVKKLRTSGGAHQPTGYDFGHGDVGEGSAEAAPVKAAGSNPADAAPAHSKAPKPHEEGALRAKAYQSPEAKASAAAAAASQPPESAMAGLAVSPPPERVGQEDPGAKAASEAHATKPLEAPNGRKVVMLVSSMPSTTVIEGNQITLRNIFRGKLSTGVNEVDGVLPENKDARSAMFECSGKRGAYPQVFFQETDGNYTNVGDFDEIQSLNDTDSLPPDVLSANPGIPTFTKSFADFLK